jgi:4-amino-4-deoxy-L-arabinose transferase-like glycosyltransferase
MFGALIHSKNRKYTLLVLAAAAVLRFCVVTIVLSKNPQGFFKRDLREYWAISENLIRRGVFSLSGSEPILPDHRHTPVSPLFISVFLAIDCRKGTKIRTLLTSGALMGAAALCRPVALFFPAVVVVTLVFSPRDSRALIRGLPLYLAAFLLAIVPWVVRNQIRFHTPFVSTIGYTNMLQYRAAGVVAAKERIPFEDAQQRLLSEAGESFEGSVKNDPVGFLRHQSRIGGRIVRENPRIYLRNNVRSALRLLVNPAKTDIDVLFGVLGPSIFLKWATARKAERISRVISNKSTLRLLLELHQYLYLLVLWVFALLGLGMLVGRKNMMETVLVLLTLAYFVAVTGGPEANARFRVPILPFIAAAAGCGLANVFARRGMAGSSEEASS